MKKYLLIITAFTTVITGTAFQLLRDNGKAGYTGSPGELTCSDCHGTASTGTIYLTSDLTNGQYIPGQTYTISTVVKEIGRPLFGVAVEALTTTNTNAGTLIVSNPARMHILTKTVNLSSRNNITHQLNAGLSTDSSVFTFNWVAPSTNIGNITFYYAGVAANNNGNDDSGDHVYHSSLVVTPGSASALEETVKSASDLKIITIAAEKKLMISFNAESSAKTDIILYDMDGRSISELRSVNINPGQVNLQMDFPSEMQSGIYIIKVRSGQQELSSKITILL